MPGDEIRPSTPIDKRNGIFLDKPPGTYKVTVTKYKVTKTHEATATEYKMFKVAVTFEKVESDAVNSLESPLVLKD